MALDLRKDERDADMQANMADEQARHRSRESNKRWVNRPQRNFLSSSPALWMLEALMTTTTVLNVPVDAENLGSATGAERHGNERRRRQSDPTMKSRMPTGVHGDAAGRSRYGLGEADEA